MSVPLFPSLRPNIMSPFWCELDPPIDEEAEILQLEREHREWKEDVSQMFGNAVPIGKVNQDVDDDDLDDMGDDEDDTTSSDGDDMDDDNDVPGMFRIHDNLSPSPDVAAAAAAVAAAAAAAATAAAAASVAGGFISSSPTFSAVSDGRMREDSSDSSSSSESSVTVTLNRVGGETTTASPGAPTILSTRAAARPARMIVGTHIPAPRPGMPQQPVRLAFINTSSQATRQQSNAGSVSPTSRAYIDAALQSSTGQFHLDIPDDDDDSDDDIPDRAAPPQSSRAGRSHTSRPFPGPVSDHLSRYQQMMAAGNIRPSLSSTQIDSLIESMHQRAHAAAARAAETAGAALPSTSSAEPVSPSNPESDSDSSSVSHEEV